MIATEATSMPYTLHVTVEWVGSKREPERQHMLDLRAELRDDRNKVAAYGPTSLRVFEHDDVRAINRCLERANETYRGGGGTPLYTMIAESTPERAAFTEIIRRIVQPRVDAFITGVVDRAREQHVHIRVHATESVSTAIWSTRKWANPQMDAIGIFPHGTGASPYWRADIKCNVTARFASDTKTVRRLINGL